MIKIWFFGTPHLSLKVLEDLYNSNKFEISFVVTSIDKPIWRSQKLTATWVKTFAINNNIPFFTPIKLRENYELFEELKKFNVDYFVVVAYGKILPNDILEIPAKMCVNVHGSILPLYRWASPIQSALINGELITWVTIMKMSEWMDEGDIIDILPIPIEKFDTTEILFKKFEEVSGKFLVKTLIAHSKWEKWTVPQINESATYCKKINKEDWIIDFNKSAQNLFYLWRWLTPWPWIYTFFEGKKLIITKCDYIENDYEWIIWEVIKWEFSIGIKCSLWVLILEEVKLEWKWNQNIKDFINWRQNFIWYKFI